MFCVFYEITHTWGGENPSTYLYRAFCETLTDALTWAGFYHGYSDTSELAPPEDEYLRTFRVRAIYEGEECRLDTCPDDYLVTDLSCAEIDSIPLHVCRYHDAYPFLERMGLVPFRYTYPTILDPTGQYSIVVETHPCDVPY